MNKIAHVAENLWADYLTEFCDRGRVDEALSIVGGFTVAFVVVYALCAFVVKVTHGQEFITAFLLVASYIAYRNACRRNEQRRVAT